MRPAARADLGSAVTVLAETATALVVAKPAGLPSVPDRSGLEPGVHGLLVPPDDPVALADALREVILGKCDRRPEPDLPLDFAAHLDGIESIYDDLLASVAPGAGCA